MNNYTTSEVLDLAADEIQRRGWAQGGEGGVEHPWGTEDGPVCLEGAIFAVVEDDFSYCHSYAYDGCPAYRAVTDYLCESGEISYRPFYFNDRPGRTQEDVIAVLRAAAAVERAKEAAYAPEKVAA